MDIFIIVSVGIGLLIFVFMQMVLFRFGGEDKTPQLVIYAWGITFIILCIGDWVYFKELPLVGMSVAVYLAVSALYLFIPFSGFESSITLQLLRDIAKGEGNGISRDVLLQKNNVKAIVAKRLARLEESDEIRRIGNRYELTMRASVFIGREYLSKAILYIFPRLNPAA